MNYALGVEIALVKQVASVEVEMLYTLKYAGVKMRSVRFIITLLFIISLFFIDTRMVYGLVPYPHTGTRLHGR